MPKHECPNAATIASEQQSFGYNWQGEKTGFTDQNGTVHGYNLDVLGRLTADIISTLGSGVDGSIRRLGYSFNDAGLPFQQTSYSDTGGTTIANQVQDAYSGYAQLITEYQSHSGAVNTSTTPKVQYVYSQPTGANYSRITDVIYPNGRDLGFTYYGGLDSICSRISTMTDYNGQIQEYNYLGLSTIVRAFSYESGLSYVRAQGESTGDAGDIYTGLDRFGRVDQQRWSINLGISGTQGGDFLNTITDNFTYGYDRDSNALYKNNALSSTKSELYHQNAVGSNSSYDQLNRILSFERGTLSSSGNNGSTPDQITSPTATNNWNYDALGNWTSTQGGSQSRTFNAQNQIASISGLTTPTYDSNGNTTRDQAGNAYTFDAWNHIVSVNGTYAYQWDALGRKIYEGTSGRDLYYNTTGNVIEERNSGGTVTDQYVWGLRSVNDLILRDDNSVSGNLGIDGSGLGHRLYVQQDANSNVTALVDGSTGGVVERFLYDPYGNRIVLNANWTSTTDSFGWVYGFQGGRTDTVSGLVHFGAREYNPALGMWMQQDPVGYVNGADLYQLELSDPVTRTDPLGTAVWPFCSEKQKCYWTGNGTSTSSTKSTINGGTTVQWSCSCEKHCTKEWNMNPAFRWLFGSGHVTRTYNEWSEWDSVVTTDDIPSNAAAQALSTAANLPQTTGGLVQKYLNQQTIPQPLTPHTDEEIATLLRMQKATFDKQCQANCASKKSKDAPT